MSDACKTQACLSLTANPYKASSGTPTKANVNLKIGDSTTGTHATEAVVLENVIVAELSLPGQLFGAVYDTNNTAIQNGAAGIFGLGMSTQSFVQAAVFNNPTTADAYLQHISTFRPLVSALVEAVEQPLFASTLQHDTIDVGGKGSVTIGELPSGTNNSLVTWVPVGPTSQQMVFSTCLSDVSIKSNLVVFYSGNLTHL
ncbi:hypothetical protein BC835DRAFT_1522288 [Cytidiella melzeri]|nr:hypothetical protein BC835DRAFT_1522288 [Cytidiella melzeri]